MPEISRFYGIVITIYFNDHAPPHFHAKYGGQKAKIAIASGAVLEGQLPRRVIDLVDEWRAGHVDELQQVWSSIMNRQPYSKIEPLE